MYPQKTFNNNALISKAICSLPLDYNAFTRAWELACPADKTLANLLLGLVKEKVKL